MSAASSDVDFVLVCGLQEAEKAEAVDRVEHKKFEALTVSED